MSIVVDELEALVIEALPGDAAENAAYLHHLIDRLSILADELDPPDADHDADTAHRCPTALLVGNPIDGLRVIGPFASGEDAYRYSDRAHPQEWWAVAITAPEPAGEPR